MFIPPNHLKDKFAPTPKSVCPVRLKSAHLLIDHIVASQLFGAELNVHLVYYPKRNTIMIAKQSDDLFKQLHKAKQHMLKGRNNQGDKSIAIHEILIDHKINNQERDLEYNVDQALGVLTILI